MLINFKNDRAKIIYSKNQSVNLTQKTSLYLKTFKQEKNPPVKDKLGRESSPNKVTKSSSSSEIEVASVINAKSAGDVSKKAQYIDQVRKLIMKNRRYPRIAQKLKQEGVVEVYFEVEKTNIINRLEIREASAFKSLNEAAIEAVKNSNLSELEFPKEIVDGPLKIQLPMEFELL